MTEPFAWFRYQQGSRVYYDTKKWDDCQPLYTHPPQRTWVGLTDKETRGCIEATIEITDPLLLDAVNAVIIDVERLLREKNT
jgi:hypothetical protein